MIAAAQTAADSDLRSTHDRILDGALHAIAEHGLSELAMRDVGRAAGVARGTVYRHFANREALIAELAQREAQRFMGVWRDQLAEMPVGEDRLRAALEYPARAAANHPVLHRLVETDVEYVVRAIREHYPTIRDTVEQLVGPVIDGSPIVASGLISTHELVDWFVRVMLSTFLLPAEDPAAMGRELMAIYRAQRGATAA